MALEIHDFPAMAVSKMLFHVPGQAVEGGYTSGAVRIMSPEPGGRSVLEMQVSLQVGEWDNPFSSWLMSKGNGEVFKVRLAPTPQVLSARSAPLDWHSDQLWSQVGSISTDMYAKYTVVSLEGSTSVTVDMSAHGDRLRPGHVIGHESNCYIVDKVVYNSTTKLAVLTVKPPLRNDIAVNDQAIFRPYFLGTISNIDQMRVPYEASNIGLIQIGSIIFNEAIV